MRLNNGSSWNKCFKWADIIAQQITFNKTNSERKNFYKIVYLETKINIHIKYNNYSIFI